MYTLDTTWFITSSIVAMHAADRKGLIIGPEIWRLMVYASRNLNGGGMGLPVRSPTILIQELLARVPQVKV